MFANASALNAEYDLGVVMKWMACVGGAMAMLAGTAYAGDWRMVGITEGSINLIDASSLRATSSVGKSGWIGFVHAGAGEADYTMANADFVCPTGMMRMVYVYRYRADGSVVNSFPMSEPMSPPPPDSVGAEFVRAACDGRYSDTGFSSLSEMFNEDTKAAARLRSRN